MQINADPVLQDICQEDLTHLPSPECRIYLSVNWVSIGSDNGLSPVRRQAITWTNAHLLSIGPLGTKFGQIRIKTHKFSFKKMHFKSSAKRRPFCPGEDELTYTWVRRPFHKWLMSLHLTHWGWDKMDAISQRAFSNALLSIKMHEFLLKFHWNLFRRVQSTIFQHWFR